MRRVAHLTGLVLLLVVAGCRGTGPAGDVEATSLLGRPLVPPALDPEARDRAEANLAEAEAAWEADPESEEAIIWLGRRQAYLGRYRQAIETFTDGLGTHPGSSKLRRHRGHRYITTRQLDRAIADLADAAAIIEKGIPDEIEPDGLPNALNQPRSTSHTNIYYHLGLARYLVGDYDGALQAYERCLAFVRNDDMLVATVYWLYLTLHRIGEPDRADTALIAIQPEMDIIENDTYHRLLLLFKGGLDEEAVATSDDLVQSATAAYGIACWHRWNGRDAEARAILERLASGDGWAAFGAIAAEADLARWDEAR
ncbi:MAG: hypothetical protein ACYTJ0_11365 [Planctomycetota bacterium]|jgi:tetratricopeptide (TPR) repeat protein